MRPAAGMQVEGAPGTQPGEMGSAQPAESSKAGGKGPVQCRAGADLSTEGKSGPGSQVRRCSTCQPGLLQTEATGRRTPAKASLSVQRNVATHAHIPFVGAPCDTWPPLTATAGSGFPLGLATCWVIPWFSSGIHFWLLL